MSAVLIHSVSPAHLLVEQPDIPQASYRQVGGSFLEGVDTPEGFRLSRIHSTDPAMYLKQNCSPGSIYQG